VTCSGACSVTCTSVGGCTVVCHGGLPTTCPDGRRVCDKAC
jgi:hypothetical protein